MTGPGVEEILPLLGEVELLVVEELGKRRQRGMRLAELARRTDRGLRAIQIHVRQLRQVRVLEKVGAGEVGLVADLGPALVLLRDRRLALTGGRFSAPGRSAPVDNSAFLTTAAHKNDRSTIVKNDRSTIVFSPHVTPQRRASTPIDPGRAGALVIPSDPDQEEEVKIHPPVRARAHGGASGPTPEGVGRAGPPETQAAAPATLSELLDAGLLAFPDYFPEVLTRYLGPLLAVNASAAQLERYLKHMAVHSDYAWMKCRPRYAGQPVRLRGWLAKDRQKQAEREAKAWGPCLDPPLPMAPDQIQKLEATQAAVNGPRELLRLRRATPPAAPPPPGLPAATGAPSDEEAICAEFRRMGVEPRRARPERDPDAPGSVFAALAARAEQLVKA